MRLIAALSILIAVGIFAGLGSTSAASSTDCASAALTAGEFNFIGLPGPAILYAAEPGQTARVAGIWRDIPLIDSVNGLFVLPDSGLIQVQIRATVPGQIFICRGPAIYLPLVR